MKKILLMLVIVGASCFAQDGAIQEGVVNFGILVVSALATGVLLLVGKLVKGSIQRMIVEKVVRYVEQWAKLQLKDKGKAALTKQITGSEKLSKFTEILNRDYSDFVLKILGLFGSKLEVLVESTVNKVKG